MFRVTTVNLTTGARHGNPGSGARRAVEMSADELVALLETFAEIDPSENNEADPEIRIETPRNRLVIRTGQKKLLVHNPRDLAEPAYVLSAREIIAELDGSAADARRMAAPPSAPVVTNVPTSFGDGEYLKELPPRPPPEPPSFPGILLTLVVLLAGYVAYAAYFAPRPDQAPPLAPLPATEVVAQEAALTGSYMTGIEPGHHGIVILAGGRLELFQVNARGGPGTVYGTYTLGRNNGDLALRTDQPGGLIKVNNPDSLEFCGETYKRVKGR